MNYDKKMLFVVVFVFSFVIHTIGVNQIGRTWDEQFKVDMGFIAWDRLFSGDFSKEAWKMGEEHPMVAKYIYGLAVRPHMIPLEIVDGNIQALDFREALLIKSGNYILTSLYDSLYAVEYDLLVPRLLSAVFNSLAVAFVFYFAFFILKGFWILVPSLFMLLMPRFVVMGQLITYESISAFFFLIISILFFKLLNNPKKISLYIIIGILCGLIFWTRYNNVFIFPFLLGWLVIHYWTTKERKIFSFRLITVPIIAFLLGIIIWPLMWQDFPKYIFETFSQNRTRISGASFYYPLMLIFTTPIPILAGFSAGIFFSFKERSYWLIILLWWFFSTLIFFSFLTSPTGGTRYIFVIYPSVALLSTFGFFKLLKEKFLLALVPFLLFMTWEMFRFSPYYLDYYNNLIGGVKGAAGSGYEVSWWGEGQREVGFYINENLPLDVSVGFIVTPKYVFPNLRPDLKNEGYVNKKTQSDYLVVSRSDYISISEDLLDKYDQVYSSQVDGEPLVSLLKKK